MRRPFIIRLLFTFLLLLGNLFLTQNGYADEEDLEYRLKAAFILNFSKFTTWPNIYAEEKTFTICISGSEDVEYAFAGLENRKIGSKPVRILPLTPNNSNTSCHVIFISKTNAALAEAILQEYQQKPVLLVSDIEEFADAGGIIEFVMIKNRLGFIINNTAARRKGLEINSSLLSLAEKVF